MKDEEAEETELEEIRSFDQRFYLKRGDKKDIIFHDDEECFSLPPGLPSVLVKQFCFVYWVAYCDGKEQGKVTALSLLTLFDEIYHYLLGF